MDRAWDEADRILQEAVTMNRKNSPQNFLAGALAYLAYADLRQSRRGALYQHLQEALQLAYQSRIVYSTAYFIVQNIRRQAFAFSNYYLPIQTICSILQHVNPTRFVWPQLSQA